jgi:hypothetical protein
MLDQRQRLGRGQPLLSAGRRGAVVARRRVARIIEPKHLKEIIMRKSIVAAVLAASAATGACGHDRSEASGPIVSRNFQAANFDKVEAAGPFDVIIRTGAAPSVQARGNQSLIDQMEVAVEDGELHIRTKRKKGWFGGHNARGKAQVMITVPELHGATLAGSGGITIDKVRGERFDGAVAGAGDLKIDSVDVGLLSFDLAGAGSASVRSGKARKGEFDIAGSGDVDTGAIAMQDLSISIAGSGNIRAQASGSADVDIMGSGNVGITGGAKCNVTKMGAGNVQCS